MPSAIFTILSLLISLCSFEIKAEEYICTLNAKKPLHVVSDKFISFSVDPAVLLSGFNVGLTAMVLIKYLNPAYVRIAGPSTSYLQFFQNEIISNSKETTLAFNPTMWKSLNEWFSDANVTPIFALNYLDVIHNKSNTQKLLTLLELTNKMNANCLWQLDYDKGNLTTYKEELGSFKHLINIFPNGKENWKIIGGDVGDWLKLETVENIKRSLNNFENLTAAVTFEKSKEFPSEDHVSILHTASSTVPIWLLAKKEHHPVAFQSAINWAKELGEAASLGYEVIFREPRLYEFFSETPVYWVTLLHKRMIGKNVLEIKPNQFSNSKTSVYCHCAKMQNEFSRRGAVTIFVVNDDLEEQIVSLRIPNSSLKNTEVQSYILTTDFEDSANTFLNGEKISIDALKDGTKFVPKLRRARIQKYLSINVPPKSIGFFVLPDTRIPICATNEDDIELLLEEIDIDQNIEFNNEIPEISSRINEQKASLDDLYLTMEKELELDEQFYKDLSHKPAHIPKDVKDTLLQKFKSFKQNTIFKTNTTKLDEIKSPSLGNRRLVIEKIDIKKVKNDLEQKKNEFMQKITNKSKFTREKLKSNQSSSFDQMSSREMEEILSKIIKEDTMPKRKIREAKGGRGGRGGGRGGAKKSNITFIPRRNHQTEKHKREINMGLLEEKVNQIENSKHKDIKNPKRTKQNQRRYSQSENSPPIVQPKEFYKEESDVSKIDVRKFVDDLRKKNYNDYSNKEDLESKYDPKSTSRRQDSDFDYLEDDEYSDMYEEISDKNKKATEKIKFPLMPTFVYKKKPSASTLNQKDVFSQIKKPEKKKDLYVPMQISGPHLNQQSYLNPELYDIDYVDYYDDIQYDDYRPYSRYKREEPRQYTEDDVKYYKQIMDSNIRYMKDSIRKQKLQAFSRKDTKPLDLVQKLKSMKQTENQAPQPLSPSILDDQPSPKSNFEGFLKKNSVKINLEENKKRNNIRFLKNRLAQQKMRESLQKTSKTNLVNKNEEIDSETKDLIKAIKTELRNRKQRSTDFEMKYVPNVQIPDRITKKYVSKFRQPESLLRDIQEVPQNSQNYIRNVETPMGILKLKNQLYKFSNRRKPTLLKDIPEFVFNLPLPNGNKPNSRKDIPEIYLHLPTSGIQRPNSLKYTPGYLFTSPVSNVKVPNSPNGISKFSFQPSISNTEEPISLKDTSDFSSNSPAANMQGSNSLVDIRELSVHKPSLSTQRPNSLKDIPEFFFDSPPNSVPAFLRDRSIKIENTNFETHRLKRYIKENSDHSGNDISDIINTIFKNSEYILPKFHDADITLVLPSKDEIMFSTGEDSAQINFKHNKAEKLADSTYPSTEQETESSIFENSSEVTDADVNADSTTVRLGDFMGALKSDGSAENERLESVVPDKSPSHLEKVSYVRESNHLLDNFFNSISNVINEIHNKIKYYINF